MKYENWSNQSFGSRVMRRHRLKLSCLIVPNRRNILGFCDRASWANCEVREKTNKMQQLGVYFQQLLNMFRPSLCSSSGDQDVCYCTWCAALVLLDVVGSGCGALRCRMRALWRCTSRTVTFTVLSPYNAAPHNRYQPHPAEPAQHTTCSNTRLGLLNMGIMMPETCWEVVENKHLTVASCWFSLSLHNKTESVSIFLETSARNIFPSSKH